MSKLVISVKSADQRVYTIAVNRGGCTRFEI